MTTTKRDALLALKAYIEQRGIPTDRYIDMDGEDEFCPIGFLLAHGGMSTNDLQNLGNYQVSTLRLLVHNKSASVAIDTLNGMGFTIDEMQSLENTEYADDPVQAALDWIDD